MRVCIPVAFFHDSRARHRSPSGSTPRCHSSRWSSSKSTLTYTVTLELSSVNSAQSRTVHFSEGTILTYILVREQYIVMYIVVKEQYSVTYIVLREQYTDMYSVVRNSIKSRTLSSDKSIQSTHAVVQEQYTVTCIFISLQHTVTYIVIRQ